MENDLGFPITMILIVIFLPAGIIDDLDTHNFFYLSDTGH